MTEKNLVRTGSKITVNGEHIRNAIKMCENYSPLFAYQSRLESQKKPGVKRKTKIENTKASVKTYVKTNH